MRSIFSSLFGVVIFGLLSLAIIGAIVALVGALIGWTEIKEAGGAMAGFGALGFIAVLGTPIGRLLGQMYRHASKPNESGDGN
jgi:hypothetical protein